MTKTPYLWTTRTIARLIDQYLVAIDQAAFELTQDRRFDVPTETDKAYDRGFLEGYRTCLDLLTRSLPCGSKDTLYYPSREQVDKILRKAEESPKQYKHGEWPEND
jgi:hypothetical protein